MTILTESENTVLKDIALNGISVVSKITKRTNLSTKVVSSAIKSLIEKGMISDKPSMK